MTVKELKDNLAFCNNDAEVVFEINCDIKPESITATECGWYTVHLADKLKPTFFRTTNGDCRIGLEVRERWK